MSSFGDEGLTWQGFSIEDFAQEFAEATSKTRRDSKVLLRAGANRILEASRQMCPVEKHNLEDAHHIAEIRLNRDYMTLEVEVGGYVDGRDVDDYAWLLHEFLKPYGAGGHYDENGKEGPRLGPASELKDESNPSDRRVGGKFLERAVDFYEEAIFSDIEATLPASEN